MSKPKFGIEVLSLAGAIAGRPSSVHPTLIWDDENIILVDTGYPGQLTQIKDAFQKAGMPFQNLNKIIITHSDIDHIGGLRLIVDELLGGVEVLASAGEKPYIECEKPPIRLSQMQKRLASMDGDQYLQFKSLVDNMKANYLNFAAKVDRTVTDQEELPWGGGIEVIFTPGHTPGHICLYLPESKILIAGDALSVVEGQMVVAESNILDKPAAMGSLKKLAQYDIQTVVCYHGGMFDREVNRRIIELAG